MARVTLDIDDGVLHELHVRQYHDGRPLGRVASELLARALAESAPAEEAGPGAPSGRWRTQPMGARVDLDDPEAIVAMLEPHRP